jgi:hypothetical protein
MASVRRFVWARQGWRRWFDADRRDACAYAARRPGLLIAE